MACKFVDDPILTYGYDSFHLGPLDGLEEDDELVIWPLDVDCLTDEEGYDENEIGPLQTPIDVAGRVEDIKNVNVDDEHWNSSDDELISYLRKRLKTLKYKDTDVGGYQEYTQQTQSTDGSAYLNPLQIFEKFIGDSLIDYIVEQRLFYAVNRKSEHLWRFSFYLVTINFPGKRYSVLPRRMWV